MSYVALYRKFRPDNFADVKGQDAIVTTLKNQIISDRLSHAYLFCGTRGTGKTTVAKLLAKTVNCEHPIDGNPCGECASCRAIAQGASMSVTEIDAASNNGVDNVRQIIEEVQFPPADARYRVYIIDEVHMLSAGAFNALLKTLEEPPAGVTFILCGRTVASLLPTIVSRCQVVPFSSVPPEVALARVQREAVATPQEAVIALSVAGSASHAVEFLRSPGRRQVRRLVVSTLDQLARDDSWDVLQAARQIVEEAKLPLADVAAAQKEALDESSDFLTAAALKQLEDANKRELSARERSGMMEVLAATESVLRDVLVRCEDVSRKIVNEDAAAAIERIAAATGVGGVTRALAACSAAAEDLAHNVSPQLALEAMLLSIKEALACPPSFR